MIYVLKCLTPSVKLCNRFLKVARVGKLTGGCKQI